MSNSSVLDREPENAPGFLLATFALLSVETKVAFTTHSFLYVQAPWTGAGTGLAPSYMRARQLDDGRFAMLCTKMGSDLPDMAARKRDELNKLGLEVMTVEVPLGSEGAYWAHDDDCFAALDWALNDAPNEVAHNDATSQQQPVACDACASN